MELKPSISEAWKLFALGTLVWWLFLIHFLGNTPYNVNFFSATTYIFSPTNTSKPSTLPISATEESNVTSIDILKRPIKNKTNKQTSTQHSPTELGLEKGVIYELKPLSSKDGDVVSSKALKKKKCNIYDGRWVYKPEQEPSYDPLKCPFLEEKMSCRTNGRPDLEYERWSWEAYHCNIPLLNGTDMVERLRNKRVILVGDSLNRNMWESLACILYSSIPSSRAVIRRNESIGLTFLEAKDYNLRVEFYWSPFLAEYNTNYNESGKRVVSLENVSSNAKYWPGADIMLFNSGHWWAQPGTYRKWDLLEYNGKFIDEMKMEQAFKLGMQTWKSWVEQNVDPIKTTVLFRSYSPEHKDSQQWCYKKTQPLKDEPYIPSYPLSFINIAKRVVKKMMKPKVKYLDITKLSEYRIDAHPAMYRYKDWKNLTKVYAKNLGDHADCGHWCLPGVPDTWNRLLYYSLFFDDNL